MTDWHAWHDEYEEPGSSLARRLAVVRRELRALLDGSRPVRRVLSLCAGDGRDVLPVVADQPADRRPELTLVELDPELAAAARRSATELGVAATVVIGDAGSSSLWRGVLPVDLLLLCGIFGNIADTDIRATVEATRAIVAADGHVVWTRGARGEVDLRPQVRQWFADAGLVEVGFEGEPHGFGVGVHRLPGEARTAEVPAQLFTFVR